MATTSQVPASLKTADITRFAIRAQQLEQAKPVISYWCKYWIVQIILAKGLHSADDEAMNYTMNIMDQLEQVGRQNTVMCVTTKACAVQSPEYVG